MLVKVSWEEFCVMWWECDLGMMESVSARVCEVCHCAQVVLRQSHHHHHHAGLGVIPCYTTFHARPSQHHHNTTQTTVTTRSFPPPLLQPTHFLPLPASLSPPTHSQAAHRVSHTDNGKLVLMSLLFSPHISGVEGLRVCWHSDTWANKT